MPKINDAADEVVLFQSTLGFTAVSQDQESDAETKYASNRKLISDFLTQLKNGFTFENKSTRTNLALSKKLNSLERVYALLNAMDIY